MSWVVICVCRSVRLRGLVRASFRVASLHASCVQVVLGRQNETDAGDGTAPPQPSEPGPSEVPQPSPTAHPPPPPPGGGCSIEEGRDSSLDVSSTTTPSSAAHDPQDPVPPVPLIVEGDGTSPPGPPASVIVEEGSSPSHCGVCMEEIPQEDQVTLACGHALHEACAEDLVRHRRRDDLGVVVVQCVLCRRDCEVEQLHAFRGTDPRPVPGRVVHQDDIAGTVWGDCESLPQFMSDRTAEELDGIDVLEDLWLDVLRMQWPPYSPPAGWGRCVALMRASPLLTRSASPPRRALGACPAAYDLLQRWENLVGLWARRPDNAAFPQFPQEEEVSAALACTGLHADTRPPEAEPAEGSFGDGGTDEETAQGHGSGVERAVPALDIDDWGPDMVRHLCGICDEDTVSLVEETTRLPCGSGGGHVVHTPCFEALVRRERFMSGERVVVVCPRCHVPVVVTDVDGFDRRRVTPVPLLFQEGQRSARRFQAITGYFAPHRRRNRLHEDVLAVFGRDVLGLVFPPWSAHGQWSESVEHFRERHPVRVVDTTFMPVLNRDLAYRRLLEVWAEGVANAQPGVRNFFPSLATHQPEFPPVAEAAQVIIARCRRSVFRQGLECSPA